MQARYATVGAPYPEVAAWATILFELIGGVLLIVGALTRFVGAGIVVLSVLSISYFSYYAGPDLLRADGTYNGGYEYDVALGLLGLLFFAFGAGAVSIDRLFKGKKPAEDTEDEDAYLPASSNPTSYGSSNRTGSHSVTPV
jgi:putative oxidoreductase